LVSNASEKRGEGKTPLDGRHIEAPSSPLANIGLSQETAGGVDEEKSKEPMTE